MPTIEGGCLCGAVRYRSDAEPVMQVVCHCETCRKNSGSAFSMNVAVPQDRLRIESGSPRRYEDHSGASGKSGVQMRRREFIAVIAGVAAWPLTAHAQQPDRVHRVAIFSTTGRDRVWHLHQALIDGLRELGFVEGKNIVFEHRFAEGKMERLADIAGELVSLRPEVIVAGPNTSIQAVRQASSTIPIVMTAASEPVASGLIASLARPGGNITGMTVEVTPDTYGLRLQLLKEISAKASRVAVRWNPDAISIQARQATEDAAKQLGISLTFHEARRIEDLELRFSSIANEAIDGLVVFNDGLTYARRWEIIAFAARERTPAMYGSREWPEDGGLISYGLNFTATYRRAAHFVDKILKGANPGDLPVEQPSQFELVINLKTAKALGLTISESFLLRADEVIE
jgi:putative tryptophan/tyrosine transport system substrate-binding protein